MCCQAVCVCKTIFVWKRQSLGHARCCNPVGDLQSLLAMWMCVCENVSPEPCLCLMVVLSTRWPSEPDGVWLHACESVCMCVCVSHLWASWHSSQSPHPPVLQHHTPHFPPSFILSVGCDHIKAKKGGLQVCAPKEASIPLTVTLSRSRSRSLSLSFLPLSQWGPRNPYGVRRSGDRVMDNPLGHI